jgi:hypothetical protein
MLMLLLRYIAVAFINFFSITQPPPEALDRAAIYIAVMLVAVAGFVILMGTVAFHLLPR